MSMLNENTIGIDTDFPALSFQVGKDRCSITARCVTGITLMPATTHIPEAPAYCRGIINVRGQVLPLVDVRTIFGMPSIEQERMELSFSMEDIGQPALTSGPESIVILIEGGAYAIGLVVDQVHAVESILPILNDRQGNIFANSRYIRCVGKGDRSEENVLMLNEQALLELCDTLQY